MFVMSFNPRKFSRRWISLFIFQCEEVKHYKDRMSFTQYPRVNKCSYSFFFPVELPIKSGVMCLHCSTTALCTHPEECVLRSRCMVCVFGIRVCLQKPEVFTYQSPWSWSYSRFWTSQHRELNLVFWKTSKQSNHFFISAAHDLCLYVFLVTSWSISVFFL